MSRRPGFGKTKHVALANLCRRDVGVPGKAWVAILLFFATVPLSRGQAGTIPLQLPPEVQVTVDAQPKIATVGDPIRFALDVTVPAGWQVDAPQLEKQTGDFTILEGPAPESEPPVPAQPGASVRHRIRIVAAVYKTGSFTFPPVRIPLKNAEGKQGTASSPAESIEIKSLLDPRDRSLKDLKRQAEIQERGRWGLWLSILAGAAILGALAWYLRRRRRRHVSGSPAALSRDPFESAESDLRALLALGLPERGLVKEFYVLLSEIVKKILEAGCCIQTAEHTTSEIVDSLHRESNLDSAAVKLVESFLLRCDMVKFAKYIPGISEHEAAAEDALRILEIGRQSSVARRQQSVTTLTTDD